jgi:type II secretory pathway component GspD/PulD (secretin)
VRLDDGQTIVLGGLVKNQETEVHNKIPFLGDIPFIGFLFKTTAKTRIKSNLVVYITPHVLTRDYAVDLSQEIKNIEKQKQYFLNGKFEDTILKTPASKKTAEAVRDTSAAAPAPQDPVQAPR